MNKKFDSKKILRKKILNYLNQSSEIAEYQLTLIDEIVKVTEVCIETLNNGGKIIFCGNGGSASDSQHLAAELVGRFMKNRKPIPAISINTDTSVLTSISNDFGYNYVFSKQIEALGNEKDTLFLLTTSGKSKNIMGALYKGFIVSAVASLLILWPVTDYVIGFSNEYSVNNKTFNGKDLYYCGVIGLVITGLLIWITEYYTGTGYRPVKSVALSSTTGHGTNVIQGLAVSMEATAIPALIIVAGILITNSIAEISSSIIFDFSDEASETFSYSSLASFIASVNSVISSNPETTATTLILPCKSLLTLAPSIT